MRDRTLDQFWLDHPEYDGARKMFGEYGILYAPLVASGVNVRRTFQVDPDCDFAITRAFGIMSDAAVASYIGTPLLLTLYNEAAGRRINDIPLDISNVIAVSGLGVGSPQAGRGVPFPYPILLKRGAPFTTFATNPQAVGCVVFLAFQGIKIFS